MVEALVRSSVPKRRAEELCDRLAVQKKEG
jgi:hypothetical protein